MTVRDVIDIVPENARNPHVIQLLTAGMYAGMMYRLTGEYTYVAESISVWLAVSQAVIKAMEEM